MHEHTGTTEHPANPPVETNDVPARVLSPEVRRGTTLGPQAGGGTCGCGGAAGSSPNGTGMASYV